MIGVFDSGYGGLTVLRELVRELPDRDFVYFSDNARAPYGDRTHDEIVALTWEGVQFLFSRECRIVSLACNTASAHALRTIQQELLPRYFPDRQVLGVLVPTVEAVTGVPWLATEPACRAEDVTEHTIVGVLATTATVTSGAYEREVHKRHPGVRVVSEACPEWCPMIELGATDDALRPYVAQRLRHLTEAAGRVPDAIVLGCTHYPLIEPLIRSLLPADTHVYSQPQLAATSLRRYLDRHPEYDHTGSGKRQFCTSDAAETVSQLGSRFFGTSIAFQKVTL